MSDNQADTWEDLVAEVADEQTWLQRWFYGSNLLFLLVVTTLVFVIAVLSLRMIQPPMVETRQKNQLQSAQVSWLRILMWSLVAALITATIGGVLVWKGYKSF